MTDIGYRWIEWPYARLRRELAVDGGVPTRFVYQLEYDLDATVDGLPPHNWQAVARMDHDITGPHNVAEEGLHIDLYRDGEKIKQSREFPDVPLELAPTFCEAYLLRRSDFFLDRFERWHNVGKKWQ